MKRIAFISIASILLFSCNENSSSSNSDSALDFGVNDYTENYSNNLGVNELPFKGGIIHLESEGGYEVHSITKQEQDIKFCAKRIPSELYLKNQGVDELEAALEEVKGEQLFYFEFEEAQKQDLIEKYHSENLDAGVSYLSFDISKDFALINSSGDTIPADYSVYERNYHLAPYERILVSFSGINPEEEVRLVYNDKLFGKGELAFSFASSQFLDNNIKNPS